MNTPRTSRIATRVATASLAIALPLVAAPSFADTPRTWESAPAVSAWQWLTVLVLIPIGLALVIALLVVLPGMAKRDKGGAGTWMGGPAKGVDAQAQGKASGTGGAGAQW